jgi:hypothetical protein
MVALERGPDLAVHPFGQRAVLAVGQAHPHRDHVGLALPLDDRLAIAERVDFVAMAGFVV